jgi:hypothetical protein
MKHGVRYIFTAPFDKPAYNLCRRFKLRLCDAICRIAVNPAETGVCAIRSCRLAARPG